MSLFKHNTLILKVFLALTVMEQHSAVSSCVISLHPNISFPLSVLSGKYKWFARWGARGKMRTKLSFLRVRLACFPLPSSRPDPNVLLGCQGVSRRTCWRLRPEDYGQTYFFTVTVGYVFSSNIFSRVRLFCQTGALWVLFESPRPPMIFHAQAPRCAGAPPGLPL